MICHESIFFDYRYLLCHADLIGHFLTKSSHKVFFFFFKSVIRPLFKRCRFFDKKMLSSRLSRIPFRRTFTTSLFKMAPQHHQVAVIGSGPAGKALLSRTHLTQ